MTAREFLSQFKQIQDVFSWEQIEGGAIRGVLLLGTSRRAFDPLTAVLFARRGSEPVETDRVRAGALLGLSVAEIASLMDASDGVLWKWVDGQVVVDGYAEWLHREIAYSVGFEPNDVTTTAPEVMAGMISPGGLPLELEHALQEF